MQPDFFKKDETLANSKTLEALLFASETNLTVKSIRDLLNWSKTTFTEAVEYLQYRLTHSALELITTASGLRLQIRAEHAPVIHQLWPEKQTKLSQAVLETISIIAYKQPVTRADIEQIRGVSTSSAILRQLFDKGWIIEKGHRELPGKPALIHSTKTFLDAFGLETLKDLPELPALKQISEMSL